MTYLQICRRLARACGMTASASIPAAVTGQTGNLLDAIEWAADAYTELQNSNENWMWLRSKFSLSTVASDEQYAYSDCTDSRLSATISRFSKWRLDDPYNPPKCYLTSSGVATQTWLQYATWDDFCILFRTGTVVDGYPAFISVDPQNNIVLGPTPNGAYTVTGEYQMSAQILAADGDTPEMPSQFHMLIMYDALRKYAGDQISQEAMMRAVNEGGAMRSQLLLNQLPKFRKGRSLA